MNTASRKNATTTQDVLIANQGIANTGQALRNVMVIK